MGVREQKKKETRRKIINSAKTLFLEKGFDKTSTEQIANHCGIGSGTLFNYFATKAELLIAVMQDDFVKEAHPNHPFIVKDTPEETIRAYLINRIEGFQMLDKQLFREVIIASLNAYQSKPAFLTSLMELDFLFIEELVELFEKLKETNKLDNQFDSITAAEVMYSSVMYEAILFLYVEEKELSEIIENIEMKINFIMK